MPTYSFPAISADIPLLPVPSVSESLPPMAAETQSHSSECYHRLQLP